MRHMLANGGSRGLIIHAYILGKVKAQIPHFRSKTTHLT
jgi:hypothetical protein